MRLAISVVLALCSVLAFNQKVKVSTIDIYGNRHVSADSILKAANIKDGDSIDQQTLLQKTIETNIDKVSGVAASIATMICCDNNGNYHLFIGVAEDQGTIIRHRPPPVLMIRLPEKYTAAYAQYSEKLGDAIVAGQADEDWSRGYSLIKYNPARKIQERFIGWADIEFTMISKVLRESAYENERATAAQIIAYNPDKAKVIPELLYALNDASDEVRNNATRSLTVISYYAAHSPGKRLAVPYQPFIRLLNSMVWSDRNKAASVLLQLSYSRDKQLFAALRSEALPSLIEMSQWKSASHALPAYVILCRMAGKSEDEISSARSSQDFSGDAKKLAELLQ